MLDEETYKKEIVRMWDSLRTTNKGEHSCDGVNCKDCPLEHINICFYEIDIFEIMILLRRLRSGQRNTHKNTKSHSWSTTSLSPSLRP